MPVAAGEAADRAFLGVLGAGRAVLLLGQAYDPVVDGLLSDIATALTTERSSSMAAQLVDRVNPLDLPNIRRAVTLHDPPNDLVGLASQPWSFVLSTAVDSLPVDAFRQASSSGRRLRLLFPGQATGQLAKRNVDALTILRLFGSLDEEEDRHLPPFTRLALRQRRGFEVAAVLRELPTIVGPRGCLAVVGMTPDDWLDLDDLALACSQLPPGSAHWFGDSSPVRDNPDIGDVLIAHDGTVSDLIQAYAGSREVDEIVRVTSRLMRPGTRSVRIGTNGSAFHLASEEWRNVSHVGLVLDDAALKEPDVMSSEETREAFRSFLRHSQYVPDWDGIARGFLFQRELGPNLLSEIEEALASLGSVHGEVVRSSVRRGRRNYSRLPILLTGPPASGKSRLLHWLALNLGLRGHVVLYLLTPSGRVHYESVERACRILEAKGAPAVLVFADGLDDGSYAQLNEHLTSAGRKTLVVGTRSAFQVDNVGEDPRVGSASSQYRPSPVAPRLTASEFANFGVYLAERGFSDVVLPEVDVRKRYFLLLLYRLLPDARRSIHLSLTDEYDRLLSALDAVQSNDAAQDSETSWVRQLEEARHLLYPDSASPSPGQVASLLSHRGGTTNAINLCLFCAQIGKPLPVDLLLRTQGVSFLRDYSQFAASVEATALLQEVEVDNAGTLVLDADHPIVAQLTLASIMPGRPDQLTLIGTLIEAVTWDDAAFPGDRPDQDYCVEVLQAVGPRGSAEREFQSPSALEVIAALLAKVRIEQAANIPKLLLLEANTLRLLADRQSTDHQTALRRCNEALQVLDAAEAVLLHRRATTARNAELRNVLNTRAAVHGFVVGNYLRQYRLLEDSEHPVLRQTIFDRLEEIERLAARSRGLGDPTFYPLDVTFWAYRDTLEQLPDLLTEDRVRLLERMEEVLDSAQDEPIEASQVDRFRRRTVNLAQLEGNTVLSQELAASMREKGDFSGECLLVRAAVFRPGTRIPFSAEAAAEGLHDLEEFGPAAFSNKEALDLMHRLWMAAHLPEGKLGGPDPVLAACTETDWTRWRRILDARVRLMGPGQSLFLGFCHAWALFQLEEPRLGLQEIRAVEPLSSGSTRRVGCLAVFTHQSGKAIRYHGSVRRREGDTLIFFVAPLRSELRVPPAMMTRFAVLPQVGDEVELEIGLNYRGLLPWRLA